MKQESLFSNTNLDNTSRSIIIYPNYIAWEKEAKILLNEGIAPEKAWWQSDYKASAFKLSNGSNLSINFPSDFIQQARAASCHSNSDRWSMLYNILWRIYHDEPYLLELSGDPQVVKLHKYAKAVRRDAHKMKAFVRFRAVTENNNTDEQRYIAWFEPSHNIVEYAANFFKKRFTNMRWSILTPDRCAHWEGSGEIWFTSGVSKDVAPANDDYEDAWRIYYRSIFNPARVKIKAMMSEMPQKYWKNLPEASVINDLLLNADKRVAKMENQPQKVDKLHCGPRPIHPDKVLASQLQNSPINSIENLSLAAKSCRTCSLWEAATQTVFGEGPEDARLMIIGEQPGDHEDLQGRPFVGPSGEILDRALNEIRLARDSIYITNTVKHFKYLPSGGQRVHRNPNPDEINSCSLWLEEEIKLVNPEVIVCLGKTAAQAQLRRNINITHDRGKLIWKNNKKLMITYHPAFILRASTKSTNQQYFKRFVEDLAIANEHLSSQN